MIENPGVSWNRRVGRFVCVGLKGALLLALGVMGFAPGFSVQAVSPAFASSQAEDIGLLSQAAPTPPACCAAPSQPSPSSASTASSFAEVTSLLAQKCVMCHSGPAPAANLRLDSHENIMAGGKNGSVVVLKNPQKSEIIRRIRGISQPRMPMTGPPWLTDAEMALIEKWILAGAPGGQTQEKEAAGSTEKLVAASATPKDSGAVTYASVEPIFRERCVKCHTERGVMGAPPEGLRLDSYGAILFKPERPIVVPGSPGASLLVRSILGQTHHRMPHDGPPFLDEAQIELITHWVAAGALDADGKPAPVPTGAEVRLEGHLSAKWALDGLPLIVGPRTRLDKKPSLGDFVEVRGRVQKDGSIAATRIRRR